MSLTVSHADFVLRPDSSRAITRLFVAGMEDVGPGHSRAPEVIERVMNLPDDAVTEAMADIDERFTGRHEQLHEVFARHAELMRPGVGADATVSEARKLLLGATFTHEYSIEGASLCNPSAVLHPEAGDGDDVRFLMSVRAIGEGHRSSVGFRTGTLRADGEVIVDEPGPFPVTAVASSGRNYRSVFEANVVELQDRELAAYVLEALPSEFSDAEIELRINALAAEFATRRLAATTFAHLRAIAQSSYAVDFDPSTDVSERVLWPQSPAEAHGIEDVRLVPFRNDAGDVTFYGTYTAFDGVHIAQHMLETRDFQSFSMSPLGGNAAIGKGLALFPRQVGGRYVALSRSDRETNEVAYSDDLRCWSRAETIQVPEQPWEILQLGNCGSPIETEAGWLVLTHGVGPMRTYSLGAILLDLQEPHRVISVAPDPLIRPDDGRRGGYVANVVYSCGGFAHGDRLVVPYGIGDQRISFATMSINEVLNVMRPVGD
ncbi:MAG TPA: glycoside hydrolase family 130 protein [Ilumatobacteraceae bacterium]